MTARSRPEPIALPEAALTKRRRGLFARARSEPLQASQSDGRTLLKVFGPIGDDGISAARFHDELSATKGDVTLRVHSPGGDPLAAISMFNDIVAHPGHVRAEIPGVAASAASILIMGADEISIAENAHIMVHRVWSLAIGDARAHRAEADVLESIDGSLVATYARRTGLSPAAIQGMLDRETWMRGSEAVRAGFADGLLQPAHAPAHAIFDLSIFDNVPSALASAPAPPRVAATIGSQAELERRIREELGVPRNAARKIAAGGFRALSTNDDSTAFTALAERVAAATARIRNGN